MNKSIIFGTSTPRSGGTLVSNILSVHKDILMTKDFIHFFRHIYKKYSPIDNRANQFRLVHEMCIRMKYRKNINLSPDEILSFFKGIKNYYDVISALSNFILTKNKNKKIIGETANGEWRNINNFLELNKNSKAFQVIRDPRAVLASWKKLTFAKGYKYLNIIFNWIDAINYSETYLVKYSNKRYLRLRFEDIHINPKVTAKTICTFANVPFDQNMLEVEKWPALLNNKFNNINVSSYNNQSVYGFSEKRTTQWKNHIDEWEVVLVQHLLKNYLKKLNYEELNYDSSLLKKGLSILESDEILSKNFNHFKKTGEGTDKRLNDPSKPENWSATDYTKNISARFIDTEDYGNYLKEMEKVNEKSKKIIN